jgi:uncharacterized membrane protein (DUF485 family)
MFLIKKNRFDKIITTLFFTLLFRIIELIIFKLEQIKKPFSTSYILVKKGFAPPY